MTTRQRLLICASLCVKIRAAVLEKTSFSMSGGIATNKITAKIASARHKPCMQTVVSVDAGREMILDLKITSIPGLGGKYGHRLQRDVLGATAHLRQQSSKDHGGGGGSSVDGGSGSNGTESGGGAKMASSTPALHAAAQSQSYDLQDSIGLQTQLEDQQYDPRLGLTSIEDQQYDPRSTPAETIAAAAAAGAISAAAGSLSLSLSPPSSSSAAAAAAAAAGSTAGVLEPTVRDLRTCLPLLRDSYTPETFSWLQSLCKGIDSSTVKPKSLPKSINCVKSLTSPGVQTQAQMK